MRLLILTVSLWALALAKPEMYKESEDFQYSRSSSDEGKKSGFYGAQRGNMGGNYEKAHNMDSMAQHHLSTLVRQVDGELGEGANTKTGSVFSAGNSRGIYGSGNYDLSNLKGRNFGESSGYHDSLSQSSLYQNARQDNSYYSDNAKYGSEQSLSSKQRSGYSSSNLQSNHNLESENKYQGASNYDYGALRDNTRYYSSGNSQASGAYDQSNNQHSTYDSSNQNRLTTVPVKIYLRPGGRVAVPISAPSYTLYNANLQDRKVADSSLSNSESDSYKPINNAKHYESAYSYHKKWEKHDTQPLVIVPTENPFPANSQLYENRAVDQTGQRYSELDSSNAHLSNVNGYSDLQNYQNERISSASAQSSKANSAYSGYSANTKTASASQARYQSEAQNNAASSSSNLGSSTANLNNLVEDINSRPKSYHSSFSYHKSWERRGDPYVITPTSNVNGETSQKLMATSQNQGQFSSQQYGSQYQKSYSNVDCDALCYQRSKRSYNINRYDTDINNADINLGQQSEDGWDLGQKTENKFEDLEDLGQATQNTWDNLENLGQQTQNQPNILQNVGQETQNKWNNLEENVGQETQNNWDHLEENVGQETQNKWNNLEENVGQETQNKWNNLEENVGQETQNNWDHLTSFGQVQGGDDDLGQQTENQSSQLENLGQETQNHFSNIEDLNQQTQGEWTKLEDLGQQTQSQLGDLGQETHNKWDALGQQTQSQLGDLGQETHNKWDALGQQTQSQWVKLEDLGHETQTNLGKQDFGEAHPDDSEDKPQTQIADTNSIIKDQQENKLSNVERIEPANHKFLWDIINQIYEEQPKTEHSDRIFKNGDSESLVNHDNEQVFEIEELPTDKQFKDDLLPQSNKNEQSENKWSNLGQESENPWSNLGHQSENPWSNLGQESENTWSNLGQQSENKWSNFGQQSENKWSNLGQESENTWSNLGQESENKWSNLGQQSENKWSNLGQESENKWSNFGQESENKWSNFGQEIENPWNNLGHQSENKWNNFGQESENQWSHVNKQQSQFIGGQQHYLNQDKTTGFAEDTAKTETTHVEDQKSNDFLLNTYFEQVDTWSHHSQNNKQNQQDTKDTENVQGDVKVLINGDSVLNGNHNVEQTSHGLDMTSSELPKKANTDTTLTSNEVPIPPPVLNTDTTNIGRGDIGADESYELGGRIIDDEEKPNLIVYSFPSTTMKPLNNEHRKPYNNILLNPSKEQVIEVSTTEKPKTVTLSSEVFDEQNEDQQQEFDQHNLDLQQTQDKLSVLPANLDKTFENYSQNPSIQPVQRLENVPLEKIIQKHDIPVSKHNEFAVHEIRHKIEHLESSTKKQIEIETPLEPTTEKTGFWNSVWHKTKKATNSVVKWFKN